MLILILLMRRCLKNDRKIVLRHFANPAPIYIIISNQTVAVIDACNYIFYLIVI
jgi:hypothetical protein